MKKLLTILFLFCFGIGFSQTVVNRAGASNTVADYRLMAKDNFFMPRYADTTTANTLKGIDSSGSIIYTYDCNCLWYRQPSPKKWVPISSNDSISIVNIFNNSDTSITIINQTDSSVTIQICTGSGSCDTTVITTTINTITIGDQVSFINDSTIQVCGVDTVGGIDSTICDTLTIPQQKIYSFSNWLREKSPGVVEFGSQQSNTSPGLMLLHNTYTHTGNFKYFTGGYTVYDYPINFYQNQSFQNGSAISSFLSHGQTIFGQSANVVRLGINWFGDTLSSSPFRAGPFGSTVGYQMGINITQNGSYGLRQDDNTSKNTGIIFSERGDSTDGVIIYAAAAQGGTYISSLSSKKVAIFQTNGNVKLPLYPNTRNDGAAVTALYTDASGNVKSGAIAQGGSSITIINDTTFEICSNGTNLCDTFITNTVGNIQNVYVVNSDTIVVCGTTACDTVAIPTFPVDRGFFDPDQASFANTIHDANHHNFTLDSVATLTLNATNIILPTYPNTRDDGNLSKVLGTDSVGDVLLGLPLLPVQNLTGGNNGDIIKNENGVWTPIADSVELDTTYAKNWVRVVTNGTRDTLIFGHQDPDSSLLVYDTYAGLNGHTFTITNTTNSLIQFNTTGIKSFDGVMPTSGTAGDSTIHRDASTGNWYLAPAGASLISAGNGLTDSVNRIIWGGTLYKNTTENTGGFSVLYTGSLASAATFTVSNAGASGTAITGNSTNAGIGVSGTTNTNIAVYGSASSSGTGVIGQSVSGVGVLASSTSGQALNTTQNPSSTNTVITNTTLTRKTSSTAANGIGEQLNFEVENASGITDVTSSIITKLTDATNHTSQLILTGVNNSTIDSLLKMGDRVDLTESSATTFAKTTIGTSKIGGGEIIVTVTANDGTDFQSRTLRFIWTAVNKAGTTTVTIGTPEEVAAVSTGTLTAAITAVDEGSGVIDFQANAVSSLTQTTLRCSYQMSKNF